MIKNQKDDKLINEVKKFSSGQEPYQNYDAGVKLGGCRQASYSDSHQEIVKTVSRLTTEDIKILGSASKKQKLDLYRSKLQSIHHKNSINPENEEGFAPNSGARLQNSSLRQIE